MKSTGALPEGNSIESHQPVNNKYVVNIIIVIIHFLMSHVLLFVV